LKCVGLSDDQIKINFGESKSNPQYNELFCEIKNMKMIARTDFEEYVCMRVIPSETCHYEVKTDITIKKFTFRGEYGPDGVKIKDLETVIDPLTGMNIKIDVLELSDKWDKVVSDLVNIIMAPLKILICAGVDLMNDIIKTVINNLLSKKGNGSTTC